MKTNVCARPPRLWGHRLWPVLLTLSLALLFSSCSSPTPPPPRPPALTFPDALTAVGPAIPFRDPNLLGDPQLTIEPFTEFADLQACLALGQTVYGIALQNTNVREAPTVDACRIGRIPRGTLVEITALVTTTQLIEAALIAQPSLPVVADPVTARAVGVSTTVQTESTAGSTATAATKPQQLGYVEDIQPIFQRTCIACHSAVVKQMNLQVTAYEPLMAGSSSGPVVIPGNFEESNLWIQVSTGKMPQIGELTLSEKEAIRRWIEDGALERRPNATEQVATGAVTSSVTAASTAPITTAGTTMMGASTAGPLDIDPDDPTAGAVAAEADILEAPADLWLTVADEDVDPVPDFCAEPLSEQQQVVSADLILPVSCGVQPRAAQVRSLLQSLAIVPAVSRPVGGASTATTASAPSAAPATDASAADAEAAAPAVAAPVAVNAPNTGLQAAALGLPASSDADIWLEPRNDFCVDTHFTQNDRGITALAFAPDGRLFVALDSRLDGAPDPNILYDAHHPSRSIVVYDPSTRFTPNEIMRESSRITGMVYTNGALFLNRAGEVGWIPDGGEYRTLAGGFAVNSQLFHANNGIAYLNGYLYVSAGGVRDGYSDGPIVGIGEAGAQNVVSGGNRFAARLVRAPLDRLINEYNIELFETAARGLRNPYGLTVDPAGRLWFTDNGATNVPENVSAGDEVNLYSPASSPPGTAEDATPYYGFPLALTEPQSWYTGPVVDLLNTSAPTGITWAYGTIYYGQYGRDPGLYRLGRAANGALISERIMLVWPLLALTTAPDGALWIGTGSGGLYRLAPGC